MEFAVVIVLHDPGLAGPAQAKKLSAAGQRHQPPGRMLVRWRHEDQRWSRDTRHPLHALLVQPDAGHARAGGTKGSRGAGIAGILDPDLVTLRDDDSRDQSERGLCARQDHDLVRGGANASAGRQIMRQRLAQARPVDGAEIAPGRTHGAAAQTASPDLVRKLPEITLPRAQRF
ncbi:hypothetical protein ABIE82_005459 [Bradyrhizobium diazoefficiens]